MPLLKTKNNVIGFSALGGVEKVNVDSLRTDGSYPITDASGGGVFPDGATFPLTVVVSAGGDTQTISGSTRNFGLEWWEAWV